MDDKQLDRAMKSIGKGCFVEHFEDFAKYDNAKCIRILSNCHPEYTGPSCRTRTYHSKAIFRNHCEKKALEIILKSNVDDKTKQKCELLLNSLD